MTVVDRDARLRADMLEAARMDAAAMSDAVRSALIRWLETPADGPVAGTVTISRLVYNDLRERAANADRHADRLVTAQNELARVYLDVQELKRKRDEAYATASSLRDERDSALENARGLTRVQWQGVSKASFDEMVAERDEARSEVDRLARERAMMANVVTDLQGRVNSARAVLQEKAGM